jgi:hypothetical protein
LVVEEVMGGSEGDSVDMKLLTEMEKETGRFAGETADGGKGKVGSKPSTHLLLPTSPFWKQQQRHV